MVASYRCCGGALLRSVVLGILLTMMFSNPNMIRAEPLYSPEAYAPPDAGRHLFVARGPATVPWSKELVDDFVLLQYERSENSLLGYQLSTGKIFSQKGAGAVDTVSRAYESDDAVIIGLPLRSRDLSESGLFTLSKSRECPALSLAPHIEVGELQWHGLGPTNSPLDRLQTWRVRSRTTRGNRTVEITSNHNSVYACACTWTDTRTVWRSVQGVSRSLGCEAREFVASDTLHTQANGGSPHDSDETVPRTYLARENLHRRQFCHEMTAALAFRVLVAVDAHTVHGAGQRKLSSAASEEECWLKAVAATIETTQVSKATAAGIDTVRPPRAVVLLDIKAALKSTELIQSLIAAITFDLELILTHTLDLIATRWAKNATQELYEKDEQETVASEIEALRLSRVVDGVVGSVALEIPLVCDGEAHEALREMLATPNVALTPEAANTSAVSVQFGSHIEELVTCQSKQIDALLAFGKCFASANANAGATTLTVSKDSLAGLIRGNAPGSVAVSLQQLRQARSLKHKQMALKSRQQMIDVADNIVARSVDLVDAQVAHTRVLVREISTAFSSWHQRLQRLKSRPGAQAGKQARGSGPNAAEESRWFEVFADTWCCAVADPGSILNTTTHCRGYLERKIRTALSK